MDGYNEKPNTKMKETNQQIVPAGMVARTSNWTPQAHLSGLNHPAGITAITNPLTAFREGLPICQAVKADMEQTRLFLFTQLFSLWRSVRVGDARTWADERDLQVVVEDIIDDFPSMKLEEIALCFKAIRKGEVNIYGRLDTPTLLTAIRDYEDKHTVTYRENHHRAEVQARALQYAGHGRGMSVRDALAAVVSEMPRQKKTIAEMGGSLNLTEQEMLEIDNPKANCE